MSSELGYWPWWGGSLGLLGVSVAYFLATARTLGVSGSYDRVLRGRKASTLSEETERLLSDRAALDAALLAATKEEFGDDFKLPGTSQSREVAALAVDKGSARPRIWLHWDHHLSLLVGLLLGGTIATAVAGPWRLHLSLEPEYVRCLGDGWHGWLALFVGGLLSGFGARMAGGCTSGHGLSGCSRLHPASLIATIAFFGVGVVTSLVLSGRLW